jgi:hypothetical protein
MILLQEAQDDLRIQAVASSCPSKAEYLSLINKACEMYMRRGDFMGTVEDIFVCVTNGCFVAPRYVGKIRRINVCNRAVDVENGWWRFMKSTSANHSWENWRGADCGPNLQDRGSKPVFQDIMGDGRLIRAYPRDNADIGKTIQFFGVDNNGQTLVTKNPDDTWDQGITLVLKKPFVSSSTFVRRIDYVIKEQTELPVDCYAYNAAADVLEELAHYEPSETKPQYSSYFLNLHWPTCGTGAIQPNCCSSKRGVLLRVKLKFIPAQHPTDILPIDNTDVLRYMIQAIKAGESGNFEELQKWQAAAVKEGNLELSDAIPDEEFAASNNVLGPGVWSNQVF